MELIARSLNRGYQPGIVLIDSAYGNNTSFLKELENRKLKYIGGIAKNRNLLFQTASGKSDTIRIDEYVQWISEPLDTFQSRIRGISYSYVFSFCAMA